MTNQWPFSPGTTSAGHDKLVMDGPPGALPEVTQG